MQCCLKFANSIDEPAKLWLVANGFKSGQPISSIPKPFWKASARSRQSLTAIGPHFVATRLRAFQPLDRRTLLKCQGTSLRISSRLASDLAFIHKFQAGDLM